MKWEAPNTCVVDMPIRDNQDDFGQWLHPDRDQSSLMESPSPSLAALIEEVEKEEEEEEEEGLPTPLPDRHILINIDDSQAVVTSSV